MTVAPDLLPQTEELLRPEERRVPMAVQQTASFLRGRGVWFRLSRNQEARSCRDAAHKRWRLGQEGIPLYDEMKSFFGRAAEPAGAAPFVIVHCRGDRILDMDRLAKVLRLREPPARLTATEVEELGVAYGLVNPFEPWALDGQLIASPALQVFDHDLLQSLGLPGTVMTNAGDLTWAVEFHASALPPVLEKVVLADVAIPDPDVPPRPDVNGRPTIGIITGNAPESGIALWNRLNIRVREVMGPDNYGDVSMPPVVVHSLPELGMSMELATRHEPVWEALREAAARLCQEGAQVVALACNTTHYFTPQLRKVCSDHGAEFLSMPESVGTWLHRRDIHQVALVGIRYVSDLGEWSAYREPLAGIEVERPGPRAKERLDDLAYQVKREGPNQRGLSRLRDVLHQEIESEHIVLALTELSVLLERQRKPGRSGKTIIDPLSLYADALVSRYLGLPFPLPDDK